MQIATTIAQARALFDVLPRPLGFVPTMGALHRGHLELLRRARSECVSVGVSVFVNPLQFAPGEDLERYPRDFEGDRAKLSAGGADVLFAPSDSGMFPAGFATFVDVGAMGTRFEGAIRPTHFRGVATVVAKLLHVVQPDVLYLGQKDAQQTAVIRKMVRDLEFTAKVEIVATVREEDGLALSSRNAYLTEQERAQAPTLYRALQAMRDVLEGGGSKADAIETARRTLWPAAVPEYFDVVDADTFEALEQLHPPAFIIGAARFGTTRLLDNLWIVS